MGLRRSQAAAAAPAAAAPTELEHKGLHGGPPRIHRSSFAIGFALVGLASFSVCCYMAYKFVDVEYAKSYMDRVASVPFQLPAIAFGSAFALNLLNLAFERDQIKVQLSLLAAYINLLACLSYYLAWQSMAPTVMDAYGRGFNLNRWVMWIHTTPAMIYLVSIISDFTRNQVYVLLLCDAGIFAFAFVGQLVPYIIPSLILFALSFAVYFHVMWGLWVMFGAAIHESRQHSKMTLQVLRGSTMVVWSIFPIVWVLGLLHLVDEATEEWIWLCLDICGKVMFSSSLMQGNFLTIQQRRRNTLIMVEEANRVQVIKELQDLVEQKELFISSVSHELRTPLNGIIGLSDALLSGGCGDLADSAAKTINTIRTSGSRLLNLINDILDQAALHKGKFVLRYEKVQLHNCVDSVVEICRPLAKKGVQITNNVSTDVFVYCDHGRVAQVLHNLVGNACKFTHHGVIAVSAAVRHGQVEVGVSDTGIGIPKDKFKQIFMPFEQVDMGTTRRYGGTGLGLSLVKDLIEAHEGTVSVESKVDLGTTFYFTLPVWNKARERELKALDGQNIAPAGGAAAVQAGGSGRRGDHSGITATPSTGSALSLTQSPPITSTLPVAGYATHDGPTAPPGSGMHGAVTSVAAKQHLHHLNRLASDDGDGITPTDAASATVAAVRRSLELIALTARRKSEDQAHRNVTHDTSRTRSTLGNGSHSEGHNSGEGPVGSAGGGSGRSGAGGSHHRLTGDLARTGSANDSLGGGGGGDDGAAASPAAIQKSISDVLSLMVATNASFVGHAKPFHKDVHGVVRVLSVDDDPVNQLVVQALVRPAGYDVVQAMDGAEGLKILDDEATLPDIVLLDVMMPGMSGYDVCRRMRELYPSALPIIMVSAKSKEEHIVEGLASGANDYIVKPFGRQELLARIAAHLRFRETVYPGVAASPEGGASAAAAANGDGNVGASSSPPPPSPPGAAAVVQVGTNGKPGLAASGAADAGNANAGASASAAVGQHRDPLRAQAPVHAGGSVNGGSSSLNSLRPASAENLLREMQKQLGTGPPSGPNSLRLKEAYQAMVAHSSFFSSPGSVGANPDGSLVLRRKDCQVFGGAVSGSPPHSSMLLHRKDGLLPASAMAAGSAVVPHGSVVLPPGVSRLPSNAAALAACDPDVDVLMEQVHSLQGQLAEETNRRLDLEAQLQVEANTKRELGAALTACTAAKKRLERKLAEAQRQLAAQRDAHERVVTGLEARLLAGAASEEQLRQLLAVATAGMTTAGAGSGGGLERVPETEPILSSSVGGDRQDGASSAVADLLEGSVEQFGQKLEWAVGAIQQMASKLQQAESAMAAARLTPPVSPAPVGGGGAYHGSASTSASAQPTPTQQPPSPMQPFSAVSGITATSLHSNASHVSPKEAIVTSPPATPRDSVAFAASPAGSGYGGPRAAGWGQLTISTVNVAASAPSPSLPSPLAAAAGGGDLTAALLRQAGLDHLVVKFQAEEITPEMLMYLDDATCVQLGLTSIGARMRLRVALNAWRNSGAGGMTPPA